MALQHKIKQPLLNCGISQTSTLPAQRRVVASANPVLRFVSFKTPCDPSRRLEYDYESEYEHGSDFVAPSIGELKAGVGYYKTFLSCSPGDMYFWSELKKAADGTIYLVDLHFDQRNLNRIVWICEDFSKQFARVATKVVIITGRKSESKRLKEEYDCGREIFKEWKNVSLSICSIEDDDILHDRFVLFDGMIWHFGASAGAMHAGLSAYSGPWEDRKRSLETLLETLVRENEGSMLGVP